MNEPTPEQMEAYLKWHNDPHAVSRYTGKNPNDESLRSALQFINVIKRYDEEFKKHPYYKQYIDGTPFSNDCAVIAGNIVIQILNENPQSRYDAKDGERATLLWCEYEELKKDSARLDKLERIFNGTEQYFFNLTDGKPIRQAIDELKEHE